MSTTTPVTMTAYEYTALESGQIRLLELLPGVGTAPLKGNVHIVRLPDRQFGLERKEHISFEALSYVWGDASKPFNLEAPTGSIPLTESLYGFLTRIRQESKARLLWADAVCINQNNTLEKEVQVCLMPSIYSTARHVLADLGESTPDDETAIQMMDLYWRHQIWTGGQQRVFGRIMTPEDLAIFMCIPLDELRRPGDHEKLPDESDERWDAVRRFFLRDWFSRLWVVQEFVLAREVTFYCGRRKLDWRHVFAGCQEFYGSDATPAVYGLHTLDSDTGMTLYTLMALYRVFRILRHSPQGAQLVEDLGSRSETWAQISKVNLVDILQSFRLSGCTLPQDRYFALTKLSADFCDSDAPALAPDYSSEPVKIVQRCGRFLIQQPGGEKMLQRAGLWTAQASVIPTWMQDFAYSKATIFELLAQTSSFRAAGGTQFDVSLCVESPDAITLKGCRVDDVVDVTPPLNTALDAGNWSERITEYVEAGCGVWARAKDRYPNAYPDEKVAALAPAMAMCANTNRALEPWKMLVGFWYVAIYSCMAKDTRTWAEAATKLGQQSWYRDLHCTTADLMDGMRGFYVEIMLPLVQGLGPATTLGGYFANVPSVTVPGDEIWIIQGCRLPLVLRKSEERPGMYQLVGSC
jgi:hypothetical protein